MATLEVECVDAGERLLGEVRYALVEPVVLAELRSFNDEGFALLPQVSTAGVELGDASCQLGVVDHSGLVEIGNAAPL